MAEAKKKKRSLEPEFAIGSDGKEDAPIQLPILDNEEADRAFQASAIRRAIKKGMAPETARQLYGNHL